MTSSRLWRLLRTFDKKEVKDLRKFVASPFFNQRGDVVFLFEELINCIHHKKISPTKEYIFGKLYPKEKFDVAKIHLISSILYKVLEDYLMYCEVLENKVKAKIQLSAAYRRRRLEDHFLRTIGEAKSLHQESEIKNAEFYELQYQIILEEIGFQHVTQRLENYQFQDASTNLDLAFITKKLRHACSMLSHQSVVNQTYDFGLLEKTMEYIDEQNLKNIPAVSSYYYCYKMLREQKEEDFETLRGIISEHSLIFPKDESKLFYLSCINFCIKKMNQENVEFIKTGLSIYKEMIEKKMLVESNMISRFAFRNIVSMAIAIKEFDWVENFITEYSPLVEVKYRESIAGLSFGRLNYERGNFDEAMAHLQKSDYTDLLLSLSAKTILLKIYYEIDEFDLLSSHLAAMKAFIGRHKSELSYHYTIYNNIIKYTKRLSELNFNNKKEIEKMVESVNTEKVLTERKWILKMLKVV
jgi:hypothetical protein